MTKFYITGAHGVILQGPYDTEEEARSAPLGPEARQDIRHLTAEEYTTEEAEEHGL